MQRTFDEFTGWNGSNEATRAQQVEALVDMLQAHPGGPGGYRLRRIMLTNFWLYGQQEFDIPHGRLFLAGENASGKSTVLTAALPLALDGDLRPNRLDTFGGRERHIQYYVLGGTQSATPFSHERRTAYIALEFEWCDPDAPPFAPELRQRWENGEREKTRFLTIGLSLAGNANASDPIRPLRFLITDGSQLGYDLHTTYETGNKHERRAYDQGRFKQQLEGHGIICESQAEYERQVSRYLFGFSDEKDFQKLINFLLVLRRPNLSSELNFSRVHDYLKQSLRKISSETTQRVIGTIERIDAINSEIERIQEAYNAVERIHRARQGLATVRAQLAASEYLAAQLTEDTVQSRVTKFRKDLFAADNERKRAETRSQSLQVEYSQVSGQIKALEASEGLQVAKQLTIARERLRESEAQLRLQEQSLEAARQSIHEHEQNLERQGLRFENSKRESATHLRELAHIASEESYWEAATVQLEAALQAVQAISLENTSRPEIPPGLTSLLGDGGQAEERLSWLHLLEELHQQREKLETKLHYARTHETACFQELDDARRRFQAVQDRAYDAEQTVIQALEQLFTESEIPERLPVLATTGDMTAPPSEDDESLARSVLEQFAATLSNYRQVIDTLENNLTGVAEQVRSKLNELQLLMGSKNHEISEAQVLYEQKLADPEFTPLQPTRRTLARAKLAEQGIAAFPLYALLDFASGIDSDSDEAGRIEYMLEDAGLLDALVVAPSQVAAADALLAAEDLSDCRLDPENIGYSRQVSRFIRSLTPVSSPAADRKRVDTHPTGSIDGFYGLRFDPAARDYVDGSKTDWEATTEATLAAIRHRIDVTTMSKDGIWSYDLLTGHAGGGQAHYIGKATRLRVRQRELDELNERRMKLEEELRELHTQGAQYEEQLAELQEKQAQLRKVLTNSGMEEIFAELSQVKLTLDELRGKYQRARQQTQEIRQSYNSLTAQLERESKEIAPLASDAKRVQNALIGVINLKNQAKSLQIQLGSVINTWQEYQKAQEALEKARTNETNAASLYERVRYQALQVQAELEELSRIAEVADAEELSERLRTLRERSEALITELDVAKTSYARADERANNAAFQLAETETQLKEVQAERLEKQARFVELLTAYPVEQLVEVNEVAEDGDCVRAARMLIARRPPPGEPGRESDTLARKEQLEEAYREAYSFLTRTVNREQPLLLEYGLDQDDQGNVIFVHENKSRPIELLAILSERIEMQKTLLREEERQLFENFLLQEMAEAIRTHILEADEWVQQINAVLSRLPMIGEHYALEWKPPEQYDMTKLGSHLARHYKLLRKPAQSLTSEETETLMGAFRQEIDSVRIRQQEDSSLNFMEALEQVFDYREWFQFAVLVTPTGGQRQRLTDRVAGTRSGAEQLFALYVPLFAALAALYGSAAPGAPRLLALDEAFDKVSVANTQRIIEFLVSQDFQWIMTGPQISGTGAKIPACARYLMIHEKGSLIATASASFWSETAPGGTR